MKSTVTFKVVDANGAAVSGASITPRINSAAITGVTTNSSGIGTFTATAGDDISFASTDVSEMVGPRFKVPKVTEFFLGVFKADIASELNQGEGGGGGGSYEVATESPATGSNDTFTFSGPPTLVFRNGVMEMRLGSVVGNTFVFDAEPMADDDIEGLV